MKMSISNLSWGNTSIEIMAPKLSKIGIHGIEIAPSTIWGDINKVTPEMVLSLRKILSVNNLDISGIQSLLFGHPEFQLFDKSSESAMLLHLQRIIEIGGLLGASVVVFGSPKNRVRGNLGLDESNELAAVFFRRLIPYLEAEGIVLTLEPNAPEYGSDFITTYMQAVQLSQIIDSDWIKPQIDTGCADMVGEKPESLFYVCRPWHIHLSAPNLEQLLPTPENLSLMNLLTREKYENWLVIEMLNFSENGPNFALEAAQWLVGEYRNAQKNIN